MLRELEPVIQAGKEGWWEVIEIDEATPSVTVEMTSRPTKTSPSGDKYRWQLVCDGYKAQPPAFNSIDMKTGEMNTKQSFPAKFGDSFINEHDGKPVICNPCNRNAYGGIHKDWNVGSWTTISGSLTSLMAILSAVRTRLLLEGYAGPMGARS